MKRWIIDGHNVLHASSELRGLLSADSSSTSAQRALIHRVSVLKDFGGGSVEVVFDSRHEKSHRDRWQERQGVKGIEVTYGSADTQADSIIEQRVVASDSPESYRVVTNDRMIRYAVEAAGAEAVSVEGFVRELAQIEARQSRAINQRSKTAGAEFGNRLEF